MVGFGLEARLLHRHRAPEGGRGASGSSPSSAASRRRVVLQQLLSLLRLHDVVLAEPLCRDRRPVRPLIACRRPASSPAHAPAVSGIIVATVVVGLDAPTPTSSAASAPPVRIVVGLDGGGPSLLAHGLVFGVLCREARVILAVVFLFLSRLLRLVSRTHHRTHPPRTRHTHHRTHPHTPYEQREKEARWEEHAVGEACTV